MLPANLPTDLPSFQARFGTDEQCRDYLFEARWPEGFCCAGCGHADAYRHKKRLIPSPESSDLWLRRSGGTAVEGEAGASHRSRLSEAGMTRGRRTGRRGERMGRVEIFQGRARRRWSEDDKRRLVAETLAPGETVHGVGRRRGVSASQLFTVHFRGPKPSPSGEAKDR